MSDSLQNHDQRRQRCRRLGHQVPFSYCRAPGSDLPCPKIADCWYEQFDVTAWLRENFSEDQIARITAPAKDKRLSLVELIQQAQKRAAAGEEESSGD
ncbi:MAG: hypothetical protein ACOCZE_01745 [Planctomycetota bacterium]